MESRLSGASSDSRPEPWKAPSRMRTTVSGSTPFADLLVAAKGGLADLLDRKVTRDFGFVQLVGDGGSHESRNFDDSIVTEVGLE